MVHVPPIDHDCVLKDVVTQLMDRVAKLEHQNSLLLKAHVGPVSYTHLTLPTNREV